LVDFYINSGFVNYGYIMIVIVGKALVWHFSTKFDILLKLYIFYM